MQVTREGLQGPQGALFGAYLGSFRSDNGQVEADLFAINSEKRKLVRVYVRFAPGQNAESVTDNWLSPINEIAQQQGYQRDQIVLLFVE